MKIRRGNFKVGREEVSGFTLAEVVIAIAVLGLVFQGVLLGYVKFTQQAEWTARSLAAQSLATQAVEQARAAKWDTQAWPQGVGPGLSDELGVTSFQQTNTLDIPMNGQPIVVTTYVQITTVSANPQVRQIRADCVWPFLGRGWFTNTVSVLRAPDQ